jgi:hypothetical protein
MARHKGFTGAVVHPSPVISGPGIGGLLAAWSRCSEPLLWFRMSSWVAFFFDSHEFEFALGRVSVFNVGVLGDPMLCQGADEAA